MPVNFPAADREILSCYLLGQLSAQEADEVEDRFAGDDAFFVFYEDIERALVSDYAAGLLEPSDAALFEKYYLVTPERRHQVTVVRALFRIRATELNQPARSRLFKMVGFAVATAAVLATGAILILWPQRGALKPAVVAQRETTTATVNEPNPPKAAPLVSARILRSGHTAKATSVARGSAPSITAPLLSKSPKHTEDAPPQEPVLEEKRLATSAPSHGITTSSVSRGTESEGHSNDKLANQQETPTNPTLDTDAIAVVCSKLLAKYALTKPTSKADDIVTAGSVLVLKKDKLTMAPVGDHGYYQNKYQNGRIKNDGTVSGSFHLLHVPVASRVMGVGLRTFVSGERVWVTSIEATDKGILFSLFTDAFADVRYQANLLFPLPKDGAVTADQVEKTVAEVFDIQPADDGRANDQPAQRSQPPAPSLAAPP